MSSLYNLPKINFAEKSAQTIESSIITTYEAIANKKLFPGDPVRLFLQSVAAIIIQQRTLIDFSAKQNLLAYSTNNYLDHIGAMLAVCRLPAAAAKTTLRFTLSAQQSEAVIIPKATRATPGKDIYFITTEVAEIPIGSLYVDIPANCQAEGSLGNNFLPGQINKIVDPIQYVNIVENITVSTDGADIEEDEPFRGRIRQAPESFSVAGPDGAYIYWSKTVSQSIIDVSVSSPNPGEVEIRPLMEGGELPTQDVLDAVFSVCNDKTKRPLTDKVRVLAPEVVSYNLEAAYYIRRQDIGLAASIQSAVESAKNEYILWQKSKLGKSINPSELIKRIMEAGAKRVAVNSPAYIQLKNFQVATTQNINLVYGGLEDD